MSYYAEQVRLLSRTLPPPEVTVRLTAARAFIDAHYAQPINLPAVARAALLSPFHLLRLFKRCYGRTPHQYLLDKRLEAARGLISTGTPIAQAGYRCGFHSPSAFSAAFRKRMGLSPAAYREKQFSASAFRRNAPSSPLLNSWR